MHGYTQGFELVHPDRGVVARCLSGGNRGAYPHAWASGDDTTKFVDVVREVFPLHLVTRFDSCEDFATPGIFGRLQDTLRTVAKEHRLKFPCIEDTLNPGEGRTQYIGSRKSPHFARLYEKGKQLSTMLHGSASAAVSCIDPSTGEIVSPDEWTRLELVVRPQDDGKTVAATATPEQAWGFTHWTHELAKAAFEMEADRVWTRQHRISEDDKAFRWMVKQYGKMLSRESERLGGYAQLGIAIHEQLQADGEAARHAAGR